MIHVVTGAPCSGKTTFVNENKNDGDVVIDFDALAVALGDSKGHRSTGAIKAAALAARRAAIDSIGDAEAWIIHTQPTDVQRAEYKNAVFHDLDPGIDECLRRADADGRPPGTKDAIRKFYNGNKAANAAFSMGKSPERARGQSAGRRHPRAHGSTRRGAFLMPAGAEGGLQMADETIQEVEQQEEPQGETQHETNWKAEARKWENLAKKGKAAEEELARLKEAQMSEQEKANARAEKAEAELAEMKAEAQRIQAAKEYAEKNDVPLSLLEFCKSEDMEAFCTAYKAAQPDIHSAPSVNYSHVNKGGDAKPANRDIFASFAEQQLSHS